MSDETSVLWVPVLLHEMPGQSGTYTSVLWEAASPTKLLAWTRLVEIQTRAAALCLAAGIANSSHPLLCLETRNGKIAYMRTKGWRLIRATASLTPIGLEANPP